ncbi:SGNH/GDSL hydrolase family protein [Parendozoicomonas haliclonae]|uniref:GDSL-like Lipase/Acylhydrolase n=1 Tax=Parendozoicomonas haliclonae TaxID=1960125 RepID=A0A1X7AMN8_9GAMM|nr:SGNH/GDSL hydrolase family protein [Parendozoicomonas haliclonae]SMA49247.1 GDSL-like Lipase/Acylhydrolase [Parendozoicomonas haliclonae]
MKTILCFGDSITWGFDPATGGRHLYPNRWTSVLQDFLGDEYKVIVEGLCGRFTVHDDPWHEARNGNTLLMPVLESHKPIDLLVLMLGTNDILHMKDVTAADAARGAEVLIKKILISECGPDDRPPKILLLAPPLLGTLSADLNMFCHGNPVYSENFASCYRQTAKQLGVAFFDAGHVCIPSHEDGVHLDREANRLLGEALVSPVLKALAG